MKKLVVPFLILALTGASSCPLPVAAQSAFREATLDEPTLLDGSVNVPNGKRNVSVSVVDENVRTVLHDLASQGNFNLMMDPSVTGNVTVELNHVSLNQALQSVAALGDLLILKQDGNIYLAIARQTAQDKGLMRQLSKVIPLHHTNAKRVAALLNQSLFPAVNNANTAGGSSTASTSNTSSGSNGAPAKITADPRTNAVVVIGTAREIQLAESAITKLDIPRQSKTFYLSHANALDIATMLASSIFNDGRSSINLGVSSNSSSSGSMGTTNTNSTIPIPSSMRVERQDLQEGSGINTFGGSNGTGVTSGLSSTVTLRGVVKSTDNLSVNPEGALIIPDTRQNAITIMGTAEQIAAAESLIPTLDAQLPQVAIEASLIEITSTGIKELSTNLGLGDGRLQGGFNNSPISSVKQVSSAVAAGLIGLPTVDSTDNASFARSGLSFSTNPLVKNPNYVLQVRRLITQNKAKVLANPTVVATHDSESIISIVDEVVRRVTVTVDPGGFATQTIEIGEAGIVLDVLPKIGEDKTISMRLRPSVTSVLNQSRDAQGNLITLLSKRDLLTQSVRLQDGETLVIGGLIQERSNQRIDKVPLAGDLPIVGAMFRSQSNGSTANPNKRSELVMLITPHIINSTQVTPVHGIPTSSDTLQTSLAGGR